MGNSAHKRRPRRNTFMNHRMCCKVQPVANMCQQFRGWSDHVIDMKRWFLDVPPVVNTQWIRTFTGFDLCHLSKHSGDKTVQGGKDQTFIYNNERQWKGKGLVTLIDHTHIHIWTWIELWQSNAETACLIWSIIFMGRQGYPLTFTFLCVVRATHLLFMGSQCYPFAFNGCPGYPLAFLWIVLPNCFLWVGRVTHLLFMHIRVTHLLFMVRVTHLFLWAVSITQLLFIGSQGYPFAFYE